MSSAPSWLVRRARRVLEHNWREGIRRDGVEYAYTCPSPRRYRHQWHWDSCFHAIVWAQLDPERARAELETTLRSDRGDGLLPHTVFWHDPARWRRAPFYATRGLRGDLATETIQTPLIALAWERVAAAIDDPRFVADALPRLRRHHDWLHEQRDVDGDGLITIILPDESGLDDSPKYEPVFRWMTHDRPGYFALVERCRRHRFDAHAIAARCDEHLEDVLVNTAYALSLDALARLHGDDPAGARYAQRARAVERALLERCYDERRGLFFDLAGRAEQPVALATWSALAPLALPGIPADVKRRLVEEQLLDRRRFRAPFGIPSVSRAEPSFQPGFQRYRTWRGPSWVNTAWLLCPPLRALGYDDLADAVVYSLVEVVRRHGFREYYNPLTGAGLAERHFGWSTLLLDLVSDGPSARASAARASSSAARSSTS